jgi:hypothetical protein
MWTIKRGLVPLKGMIFIEDVERECDYLENESGIRLIHYKFDEPSKDGLELFNYQDGDTKFELSATRVDTKTRVVGDRYKVDLGIALRIASMRGPPNFFTLGCAANIARNVREALLMWRYPPPYADLLACNSSARDVTFNMAGWKEWDPALEGNWP